MLNVKFILKTLNLNEKRGEKLKESLSNNNYEKQGENILLKQQKKINFLAFTLKNR